MAIDMVPQPGTTPLRLAPVGLRYAPLFCFALLAGACVLATFGFACGTPFAAFAVIAAAVLPIRSALVVVTGAWIVNQVIGFAFLGYPHDASTVVAGVAIGVAALVATGISATVFRSLPRASAPVAFGLTLIAAFAVFELVLLALTPITGGLETFAPTIVIRLGILSVVWLIGLIGVCEVFRLHAETKRLRTTVS